jgi:hypothetical protein
MVSLNRGTLFALSDDRADRRFPNPAWAWPTGALDGLICAAICPNTDRALTEFSGWLADHKVDETEFREQRLLAAVTHRFGRRLSEFPQYRSLIELQRRLWRNSSMAVAQTVPVLQALDGAGIAAMLIKGGARIALRPDEQIARVSYDIDVVVRPTHFAQASDILFDEGWSSSTGESRMCIAARARDLRAMNFFKGHFGDVDLHQLAYRHGPQTHDLEAKLWDNSQAASFFAGPVRVPSATDRIALAICHSGREAHTHSDWLIDIAQLLLDSTVDWRRLAETLSRAQAEIPAQVAFGYLHHHIGFDHPSEFISQLCANRRHRLSTRISDILQAKPRSDWTPITRFARGLVKQISMAQKPKSDSGTNTQTGRIVAKAPKSDARPLVTSPMTRLLVIKTPPSGRCTFDLEVAVDLPGVRRRIEFEFNTEKRHLMRLRARCWTRRKGHTLLRFSGQLDMEVDDCSIWLEARPGRHLRGGEAKDYVNQYRPIPAKVLNFTLR